jgi:predicted metal-dependent enzyme (double-stranded beta helix superfamily)
MAAPGVFIVSFDLEQFVSECRAALADKAPEPAVREVVARALSEPAQVRRALGEPQRAGIRKIHQSRELTVIDVVWAPHMTVPPHDHRMWAVIGIYSGREDNVFWRRLAHEPGKVEAAGARSLATGDATSLGSDIVHSVLNPIGRFTGALHVYGGDFFEMPRSEWDAETLLERPYDVARTLRHFEEANRELRR